MASIIAFDVERVHAHPVRIGVEIVWDNVDCRGYLGTRI